MKWIGGYAEQQKGENTEEWKLGEGNTHLLRRSS